MEPFKIEYHIQEETDEHKAKCHIAIDNGVTGSIGIITETGEYHFFKTPTKTQLNYTKAKANITRVVGSELIKILSIANPLTSRVIIERPMVNPGRFQATISAIRALEATQTVLEQLGFAYEFCDSKSWQKEMLPSGLKGDELKSASLDIGARLFPNVSNVKHPDRDGILMAEYLRRKYK